VSASGSSDHASFAEYLAERRAAIDAALSQFLPVPGTPELLADAMRYSLEAGGKRLRPILTLAAADAIVQADSRAPGAASTPGQACQLALPAACALELIHTYSLVHDDLPAMDNDSMRRGRPTLHVVYGDGVAILAGDGLLTEAFALLAREPQGDSPPDLTDRKLRVLQRIAEAAGASGMVGGQTIDLDAAADVVPGRTRSVLDGRALEQMHLRKTGALIRASAVAGAIMAGGSQPQVEAIDRFAAEMGLVFQIVDDILDVEGASADLGKTAGKDAAAGKPTYPALFGLGESRRRAADGTARAAQALATAGLTHNWLSAIARWVVERTS
jgi:geranylgeranyl diphosphate synthase, type II